VLLLHSGGSLAAPSTTLEGGSLVLATVPPFRTGRGGDRQRGNACGEKHPGQHEISPFRTAKRLVGRTVPTLHPLESTL
jgi:hypothetical protein